MKDIRNDFAHHFDYDSFENPSIKARCENLKLVDKYVGDLSPEMVASIKRGEKIPRPEHFMVRLEKASQELKNPRKRYIYSAMVFSELLGSSTDPLQKSPYF